MLLYIIIVLIFVSSTLSVVSAILNDSQAKTVLTSIAASVTVAIAAVIAFNKQIVAADVKEAAKKQVVGQADIAGLEADGFKIYPSVHGRHWTEPELLWDEPQVHDAPPVHDVPSPVQRRPSPLQFPATPRPDPNFLVPPPNHG